MGAEELCHPHSSAALFARISCRGSDVKSIEDAASNCPGCDQQKSFLFLNRIPGVDAAISNLNGDGSFRWLRNPRNIEEFAVLGQTIGSGAFADVFRARDIKSGQVVAVKQLEFKEEIDRCTRREIDLLACLRHPSIVELKEVAVDSGLQNLYLVMEYVGTDLRKIITKKVPRLSNWNVKHLMSQLLKGVSFMHRNGFLHRDLKPENLLVNEDMQLKICDFGLARRFDENKNYSVNVVTLWYRAPELLLGAPEYSEAVDVWAIGCIMAELMLQQPLFRGKTEVDQLDKIFRILGTPDLKCWPDFVTLTQGSHWSPYPGTLDLIRVSTEYPLEDAAYDLLNKLLTYDPKKRITAEDALKHDWFCSDSGDWMAGLE